MLAGYVKFRKRRALRSRLTKWKFIFCHTHAGHLHRECVAMLPLCCKACCGTAVQQCEQCCVSQLQLGVGGQVLAPADDHIKVWRSCSSVSGRNTEVHIFTNKLDSNFSESSFSHLHKKTVVCDVALLAYVLGSEKRAFFICLLFV